MYWSKKEKVCSMSRMIVIKNDGFTCASSRKVGELLSGWKTNNQEKCDHEMKEKGNRSLSSSTCFVWKERLTGFVKEFRVSKIYFGCEKRDEKEVQGSWSFNDAMDYTSSFGKKGCMCIHQVDRLHNNFDTWHYLERNGATVIIISW